MPTSMNPACLVSLTTHPYPLPRPLLGGMCLITTFLETIHLGLHCQWLYIKQDSALIKQIADHLKELSFPP